jgi:transposase
VFVGSGYRAGTAGPRKANGDGGMEALRILKRRLSDVAYRAMLNDQNHAISAAA